MRAPHPAVSALLLSLLASGAAWSQSAVAPGVAQPGSLPPPRPLQAPAQAQPSQPPAQRPQGQATPPAPRPAQPGAAPSATPRPPAPPRPAQPPQAARPAGQAPAQPAARAGQPPTVNRPQQPNRRPAAAAAGAAAGAAAAGAAVAASRAPEPAQPAPPPVPSIGSVTGLALPRFAALRSDEVNMRVGPNTTYPIEWTFQRRDLPVQIVGEFQLWRRIRDVDGAEGWVHSSTLAGRRTVLVRPLANAPEAVLRRRPEEGGTAVAQLRAGVIARIRECEAGAPWCEVQVAGHRGYLRRSEVWGVGPEEEVK